MRVAVWILALLVVAMVGYLAFDQWWPASHGTLVITSDPPGAQVWLDLKPTNVLTNGRLGMVSVGKHSIMLKLDTLECEPTAQVVEVRKGQTDTARFRLVSPLLAGKKTAATAVRTDKLADVPPMAQTQPPVESIKPPSTTVQPPAQGLPQTHAEPSAVVEPPTSTGVLEIATSVPGAKIFVNGQEQPQTAPTSVKLPEGTYTVRAELEGYASDPPDQTVSIMRGSPLQSVYFTLTAQNTEHKVIVETTPIAGPVLINDVPVGSGKVTVDREFGSYTVTFGDSQGWRAPDPVHIAITPTQPVASVKAVYSRLFHTFAQVDAGKPVSAGGMRWQVGAYFEDDGAHPSSSMGPHVRPIPNSDKSGWELAEGDPNHNPTGGDYVDFVFTLPPDADPKSPLKLRLYLYRSNKRYAFSLTGRSEVVVTINGKMFLDGYRPAFSTEAADEGRYEEWSLTGALVKGDNHIMIRSGEHNSLFNYLWKIEVL